MQHFRFMWLHTFLSRNLSNRCIQWCYQSISRIFGGFILFGPILSRGLVPRNATIASRRSRQILRPSKLLESNSNIFTISVFPFIISRSYDQFCTVQTSSRYLYCYGSRLWLIFCFGGRSKWFSEVKNHFLTRPNELLGLNKTYINISNGQKFEFIIIRV